MFVRLNSMTRLFKPTFAKSILIEDLIRRGQTPPTESVA